VPRVNLKRLMALQLSSAQVGLAAAAVDAGRVDDDGAPPGPLVTQLRRMLLALTLGSTPCAAEVSTEAAAALLQVRTQ
jgi:hypothetical protein